jgi:tRNA uridine 5-carboxymethylaminomethyl modification enzyme
LRNESISPDLINGLLASKETPGILQKQKLASILLRPQIQIADLISLVPMLRKAFSSNDVFEKEILDAAEILLKYEGYIVKEKEMVSKISRLEDVFLKPDFNYSSLKSLSYEAREKLTKVKPLSLGQASRISGISPADISVLAIFLGR